jgi:hypothetical protein
LRFSSTVAQRRRAPGRCQVDRLDLGKSPEAGMAELAPEAAFREAAHG